MPIIPVNQRVIITIEPCLHPELNMMQNERMEREYWCSKCRKKIVIPIITLVECSQDDIAGIIGLAFGDMWKQAAAKGQV